MILLTVSVQNFWLKENARVLVPDTGEQQSLGHGGAPGDDDLKAGRVGEVGLGRLWIIWD